MILSTAIAHTHTEHTSSPTITPLTIQCACQNSVSNERSEEVSGRADCATSGMEHPFDRTRGKIVQPLPAQTKSAPNMSKLGRLLTSGRSDGSFHIESGRYPSGS